MKTTTQVQKLVTGFRCEELGCYEMAFWYVTAGQSSFHWCSKHTNKRMKDSQFWESRIPPATNFEVTA
ncbi:MAG TPA: hypothetical protein VEJ36_03785 [Nitrososphaerales archaeon]|nr:hypothetical protein [Nitrososphaerales archaeon]